MDIDSIKKFFVLHVEKIFVGVFAVCAALLIFQGLKLEDYRDTKLPSDLASEAREVKTRIDDDHTDNIMPERRPTFDIVQRTDASRRPVDVGGYKLRSTWELGNTDVTIRRTDPTLIAPRDLRMGGFVGAVAWRSRSGSYPAEDLEPAERPEKIEEKKPEKKEKRPRGGYGMEDYAMEMEEEMQMQMEMEMMSQSMSGSSGSTWKLDASKDFGLRPSSTRSLTNDQISEEPVPHLGWFIIGTAVVPHKELWESYKTALRDADGYDPRRDKPIYHSFQVQRADVTEKPVDQLTDDDWKLIGDRRDYVLSAAAEWSGLCPEVIPAEYRDDAITTYIPPIMLSDYRKFTSHPLVDKAIEESTADELIEEDLGPVDLDALKEQYRLAGPSGSRGFSTGMYADDMGEDMGEYGGGYGGYGGYGSYGSSMLFEEDPVDYKLMRFYDFFDPKKAAKSPRPGRKYVYRIRFAVVDPNFPQDPANQPKLGALSAESYRRIVPLMQRAIETKQREFQLWSDWSEPSEPASLPNFQESYAGPVTPAKTYDINVNNRRVAFERESPKAKFVTSQFDPKYNVWIPYWVDVTEGSMLSAKGDASVVDPISLEIKKLPEAEAGVVSGTTIIDLDGGQKLSIAEGDKMTAPGTMLLYDPDGGLRVTSEIADQEVYRIRSYAEDRGL